MAVEWLGGCDGRPEVDLAVARATWAGAGEAGRSGICDQRPKGAGGRRFAGAGRSGQPDDARCRLSGRHESARATRQAVGNRKRTAYAVRFLRLDEGPSEALANHA